MTTNTQPGHEVRKDGWQGQLVNYLAMKLPTILKNTDVVILLLPEMAISLQRITTQLLVMRAVIRVQCLVYKRVSIFDGKTSNSSTTEIGRSKKDYQILISTIIRLCHTVLNPHSLDSQTKVQHTFCCSHCLSESCSAFKRKINFGFFQILQEESKNSSRSS